MELTQSEAFLAKKMKMNEKIKASKIKPLFRYYNYPDLVRLGLLYLWIIYILYKNDIVATIIISLFGLYTLSVLILSRYSFYENHLEIKFHARFWSKGKVINYDDIIRIKEVSFRFDRAFLIIPKDIFWKPELGWPWNSFPLNRKKKREILTEFLKSKNIEVIKT